MRPSQPSSPPATEVDRPTEGDNNSDNNDPHIVTTDSSYFTPPLSEPYDAISSESSADLSTDDGIDDHEMPDVPDTVDAGALILESFGVHDQDFAMDTTNAHDDELDDATSLSFEDALYLQQQQQALPPIASIIPPQPLISVISVLPPIPSTLNPAHIDMQQQAQQIFHAAPGVPGNDLLGNDLVAFHPLANMSNPNLMSLGPENHGLVDFLRVWAGTRSINGPRPPHMGHILAQMRKSNVTRVEYDDLMGDKCDFQGIDWNHMGVSRNSARERRLTTYNNYVNKQGSDVWHPGLPDWEPAPCDNYFRFRSMDVRHDVRLLHFQLRNLLGVASRTRAFYPVSGAIKELDPTTGRAKKAMDFGNESDVQISTLTANEQVLVAGGFNGEYRFRNVNSSSSTYMEGKLTDHVSGITNHVQVHPAHRSGAPLAAFASNDCGFRVLDLNTNRLISDNMYNYALNCSAVNPDHRLRVMVGDHFNVVVTDADSGEVVQELSGHRDYGFACAWAPNGWNVATGFQDKTVRIWDARKWKSNSTGEGLPVAVIRMDMSGARSLRFSPLGSGKRLLVAAEEADVINIIDAQTFTTKQKMEVFGELGGTAFADEGQNLIALVCDRARGGVLQLDRCDHGADDGFDPYDKRYQNSRHHRQWWRTPGYDWVQHEDQALNRPDSTETFTQRRRKAAVMHMDPV